MTTETVERASAAPVPSTNREMTVIEPTTAWAALRLRELWKSRELILFLIWRDIKVRYKQTAIGAGWAVLQPLITVVIFSLLLGRYAHFPSGGVNYPIFIFAGLLPWTYFAYSITQSGKSLVDNEKLITKLYFPRLALPIATTFTGVPDFIVGCVVFGVMMPIFGQAPTWRVVFMPLFFLLAIATAAGVGFWLSGLNVRYRDVKYILPFLTQIWMFASPVVYSGHLVKKGTLSIIYALNPMAGVINGFRWSLLTFSAPVCEKHLAHLGHAAKSACHGMEQSYLSNRVAPTFDSLLPTVGVTLFLLVTGVFYFKHMDKTFADVI